MLGVRAHQIRRKIGEGRNEGKRAHWMVLIRKEGKIGKFMVFLKQNEGGYREASNEQEGLIDTEKEDLSGQLEI